jgi:hypothetical protein
MEQKHAIIAAVVVVLLIIISVVIYYMTRPPSWKLLYASSQKTVDGVKTYTVLDEDATGSFIVGSTAGEVRLGDYKTPDLMNKFIQGQIKDKITVPFKYATVNMGYKGGSGMDSVYRYYVSVYSEKLALTVRSAKQSTGNVVVCAVEQKPDTPTLYGAAVTSCTNRVGNYNAGNAGSPAYTDGPQFVGVVGLWEFS